MTCYTYGVHLLAACGIEFNCCLDIAYQKMREAIGLLLQVQKSYHFGRSRICNFHVVKRKNDVWPVRPSSGFQVKFQLWYNLLCKKFQRPCSYNLELSCWSLSILQPRSVFSNDILKFTKVISMVQTIS